MKALPFLDQRGGLRAAAWAAGGMVLLGASGLGLLAAALPRTTRGAIGGATYATVAERSHDPAVLVTSLRTDGPEARAGLRVGDVIETVNGRRASTAAVLRREEARRSPAILHLRRRGDAMTLHLLHGRVEGPGDQDIARRGR